MTVMTAPQLDVSVLQAGAELVLVGRLDATTLSDARDVLHRAVDDGVGDLVVRVGDAQVRDAAALGLLVAVHRRAARRDRRLVLADVPPNLVRVLRATRLHRVMHVANET